MGYSVSEKFHNQYIDLCDHIVTVTLKDGRVIEGNFADEFYDEASILISPLGANVLTIKLSDIVKMELAEKDISYLERKIMDYKAGKLKIEQHDLIEE